MFALQNNTMDNPSMDDIFNEIKRLSNLQKSPNGVGGDLAKMNEEWGELGRLISMRMGMQDNPFSTEQFKTEYTEESVDLIQNILLMCHKEGIEWADLAAAFVRKNKKWEDGIVSGKYKLMENKLLVQVVMLPTKPITQEQVEADNYVSGYVFRDNRLYLHGTIVHLYLVSNEEIKKGDWVLIKLDDKWELQRAVENFPSAPHYKKIEATTDPAFNLPLIRNNFLRQYEASNGSIMEVEIEMEAIHGKNDAIGVATFETVQPKLYSGCVRILPKTSWNREEVEKEMLL